LLKVNSQMPADVKVITLLRRGGGVDMTDYCGFTIGEQFVVGYGLDDYGIKRELRDIYSV